LRCAPRNYTGDQAQRMGCGCAPIQGSAIIFRAETLPPQKWPVASLRGRRQSLLTNGVKCRFLGRSVQPACFSCGSPWVRTGPATLARVLVLACRTPGGGEYGVRITELPASGLDAGLWGEWDVEADGTGRSTEYAVPNTRLRVRRREAIERESPIYVLVFMLLHHEIDQPARHDNCLDHCLASQQFGHLGVGAGGGF
jgi:hypothetical protein